uniref:Uncharacterized protein n=1 Tax=Panagrolaimus sp. ES5 TaxID=591445 RepID=A0AC34GZA8_9BILA
MPAGVCLYLVTHTFRNNDIVSKFVAWRSKTAVPESLIEALDSEFTAMATKKEKRFRNIHFAVSLIDNLEARTYGSFYLESQTEFQVPVISTLESTAELKSKHPNLLNLIKELKLNGIVDTSSLPEKDLQNILLTERARQFFIRREITIAESFSHIVVPSVIGSCSVLLGYPVFKTASSFIGGYPAFIVAGAIALFFTYYIVKTEVQNRVLATDRRILMEDNTMVQGAIEYFNSRLAFGKLLHKNLNDSSKAFDKEGNCLKLNVKYTDRLKEVQKFAAENQKKPSINVRALPLLTFKERADRWIQSTWGRRFRIGLLAGTIVAYPVYHLISYGPLINFSFSKRHNVDYRIPSHLQLLVESQLDKFREQECRSPKDSKATFCVQKDFKHFDSIADGSLGVRFGAHVGLPLYTTFTNEEQALNYLKENWDKFEIFGQKFPVLWDSPAGRDFLSTFVLSPEALKFLILRDLYANDGYNAYANKAISWATWTAFSSIFTYWLHQKTRICSGTALSFAIVYTLFLFLAIYAHDQWFLVYRYLADIHGDSVASRYSYDHSAGGNEYYWKMLKRNRILRDFMPSARDYITAVGDIRGITTKIIVRYDLLKDVNTEDDEIKIVEQGDD